MKYSITTARGFAGPRRQRLDGKINVQVGFPQVIELTKEELAIVKADPILVVAPFKEVAVKPEAKDAPKEEPTNMVDEPEAKEL